MAVTDRALSLLQRFRGMCQVWTGGVSGDILPERLILEAGPGLTATDDQANGRTVLALDPAADVAVEDLHVGGTLTLDGPTKRGPTYSDDARTTTLGAAFSALFNAPLPVNSVATLDLRIAATDSSMGALLYDTGVGAGVITVGSPGVQGSPTTNSAFGLPPSVTLAWAAGVLKVTCNGPSCVITGAADNGSGKVRLTVAAGGLAPALSTQSLTISGVVGTTEANGTHVATFVDATHFDLAAVVFANAYTSGGLVVYTTPPLITWSGSISLTVTP